MEYAVKCLLAATGTLMLMGSCTAQDRVQSGSYDLMLRTLLSHSVPEISVDSLKARKDSVLVLDARAPEEYQVSHIPGARLVGFDDFSPSAVDSLDKDTPVVVYCSVGYRSEKISEKLIDMGFSKVYNLYGGIFEWVNRGHVVVHDTDTTRKIHAYGKPWSIWLSKGEKVYK